MYSTLVSTLPILFYSNLVKRHEYNHNFTKNVMNLKILKTFDICAFPYVVYKKYKKMTAEGTVLILPMTAEGTV